MPQILLIFLMFTCLNISISANAQGPQSKKFTVTIDAGHGGKDVGAPGKHSYEKDLALAIALKLGHYIETQMPDVNVYYTRKIDVFIELYERAKIANRNNSDLFISVHINANDKKEPSGTSTYVMGFSKSKENLDLVMQENKSIYLEKDYETNYAGLDPSSPLNTIIFNNVQNNNLSQSLELATAVQDQFRDGAKRKDIGVHQGNLAVLWKCAKPSILIEAGFISNLQEEAYMMTDGGQDNIAHAVFLAFKQYKESIDARIQDVAKSTGTPAESGLAVKPEVPKDSEGAGTRISSEEKKSKTVVVDKPEIPSKATRTNEKKKTPDSSTGVEFRVQVLAAATSLPSGSRELKGVKNLEDIRMDGYHKYMSEPVKVYEEALDLQKKLGAIFKGAFIVAFKNGEKVPVSSVVDMKKN